MKITHFFTCAKRKLSEWFWGQNVVVWMAFCAPSPKQLESPCGSCLSETVDSKHLKHFRCWCTFQIQLQRLNESTSTWLSHPNHLANCGVFPVGQVLWMCCLLGCIWYARRRSVLFRARVTMSRAFVMEKRHVRPQSQLCWSHGFFGRSMRWGSVCTGTLSRNGVQSCIYFRAILAHQLRQDQ